MTRKDCDLGGASANTATVNSADADVCSAEDTRPARGKEAGAAVPTTLQGFGSPQDREPCGTDAGSSQGVHDSASLYAQLLPPQMLESGYEGAAMRDTARRWAAVNEAAYRGASSPATPAALVAGAAAGIPVVSASRACSECEDEIRDAAAPGDDCYKVWDIVLQEFDEPHDIAREFLARAHRSKMVAAFFFRLRREAAKTMEDISLCIHRYLLHDAIGVGDMEDSELCFKYPTSIGGRHERIPHLSWAAQHTASAGRAFTALCWARSTLQLARVAGWLLDGEEARGRDLAHAVLRQDLGAAEKARTLLQVCIGHKDHVSQLIKLLGESGHTDLVPHLVAGAAEELAHLRQCRARVATTGWVREHMRLKMDTEEQMLGALAAVVPKHTNL